MFGESNPVLLIVAVAALVAVAVLVRIVKRDATKPAANHIGEGEGRRRAATGFTTHQPEGPTEQPLETGINR